jgi:hypothetical protein
VLHLARQQSVFVPEFKDAMGITADTPQTVYIGRRNVEGGGRQTDFPSYELSLCARRQGRPPDDGKWDYNFWWQSGTNVYQQQFLNDFSTVRANNAVSGVVRDPDTGRPVCASVLDGTDTNCVPYDIFHTGGVTQAALNYLNFPGFQSGQTSQSVVGLNLTSDWLGLWRTDVALGQERRGVAFGIERRVEKLNLEVSSYFDFAEGTGSGGDAP